MMYPERTYLKGTLATREQRHRRAVLLGIAALLVLTMSPIFGHHLGRGTDALFAGVDHVWALCLIALHYLFEPVHTGFHLLFAAGISYALWNRARAGRSVRSVLATLPEERPSPGDAFDRAARSAGVDPERVRVVDGLPLPAFTAGWLRPRIYVARELEQHLRAEELAAVLAHEGAHADRRDPLRLSVLRFLTLTLFWIPALRRLADDFADEAEIRADDIAARKHPLVLASAILALAQWAPSRPVLEGTVGFDERDLLERRVRRLAGEETPPRSHVTRRSLVAAVAALLLAWTMGTAVAHPLPSAVGHHGGHCEDHTRWALTHLFCAGGSLAPREECPHVAQG
jgi:Zn-dependent protease with chaperone function